MAELLEDICEATVNAKKYADFKYRIGTVILHEAVKEGKLCFDIVDGQQRILSLCLILKCLNPLFSCSILNEKFNSPVTQENLYNNYIVTRDFLNSDTERAKRIEKALKDTIEVVVVSVNEVEEAFQLFDSQNTRGRPLDPHDLLKAYHLREMHSSPNNMRKAVKKWEAFDTDHIKELFSNYLFPIKCWSSGKKSHTFTAKDIDAYKGISRLSPYTYAKRANKSMPYFQITSPFLAGKNFFEMVEHYLNLLKEVKDKVETDFPKLSNVLKAYKSTGFKYAATLFFCALLTYYDKFKNFEPRVVKKLFTWAFMLRVDMENLGFDSINKYALGISEGQYSNCINMFALIKEARLHTDVCNVPLTISRKGTKKLRDNWEKLYADIKELNDMEGVANE